MPSLYRRQPDPLEMAVQPPFDGDATSQIVAPFYEDTGQLSFVRNQVGCHFNLAGGGVSDNDVCAFGKAASAMVAAIVCKECGQIPTTRKGDHFACTCGKTRMRPLEI